MSVRSINFVPGEYYHIFNRGNDKREIFHDDADRHRFLKLLFTTNSNSNIVVRNFSKEVYEIKRGNRLVSIGAYCLMPNHFHLLVTQTDTGDISRFMHKLSTSYSMFYNNKYNRSGKLFEGKFKSEYADNDRYLKYLFSYIHLNPLKLIDADWRQKKLSSGSLQDFLKNYKFSSYLDYLGENRTDKAIINRGDFPDYFPQKELFISEISSWLELA